MSLNHSAPILAQQATENKHEQRHVISATEADNRQPLFNNSLVSKHTG